MSILGYSRVSTDRQSEEGESLGVQERQIRGWAMMRGEDVAEIIVERGVSGSVPLGKRPEGARLWKLAKKGDTIVCAKLDRLFRSALDALQTCAEAQKRGIEIHVIDGLGNITGNGMGKAFMTIAATFAELERDTIRERISTVKADQRDRGRYLGGKVPFGFEVDDDGALVAKPDEMQIVQEVREIRKWEPSGRSLRFIQEEIGRRHGRIMGLATLGKIVRQGAMYGLLARADHDVGKEP